MSLIKILFGNILKFFSRRLMFLIRLAVGIFMILMGAWFVIAPISQQFFDKQDVLRDAPYLWLIVPFGILQIFIGGGILRPLFRKKNSLS